MVRPPWIEQLRVAARGPEPCVVPAAAPAGRVVEVRADDEEAVTHHLRLGYHRIETSVRHVRCTDGELWDAVLLAAPVDLAPGRDRAHDPQVPRLELVA
jgi:hypothetical protein